MSKLVSETIGDRVKFIRELNGLSNKKMADILGMSEATIINIQKNRTNVLNIKLLSKLANTFNIHYDWLIDGNPMYHPANTNINIESDNDGNIYSIPVFTKVTGHLEYDIHHNCIGYQNFYNKPNSNKYIFFVSQTDELINIGVPKNAIVLIELGNSQSGDVVLVKFNNHKFAVLRQLIIQDEIFLFYSFNPNSKFTFVYKNQLEKNKIIIIGKASQVTFQFR